VQDLSKDDVVEILVFYKNKLSESEFEYLQLQIKHKIALRKLQEEYGAEMLRKENLLLESMANGSLNYQEKIKKLTDELEKLKKKQSNNIIKDKKESVLKKTTKSK
jgi:hypothetical protein